jgi:hypothetical protein
MSPAVEDVVQRLYHTMGSVSRRCYDRRDRQPTLHLPHDFAGLSRSAPADVRRGHTHRAATLRPADLNGFLPEARPTVTSAAGWLKLEAIANQSD